MINKVSLFYGGGGNSREGAVQTSAPLSGDPASVLEILGISISKDKLPALSKMLAKDREEDPVGWAKNCSIRLAGTKIYLDDGVETKELLFPYHPKEQALFLLFLKHPKGLTYNEIRTELRDELLKIYSGLKKYTDNCQIVINRMVDTNGSLSDSIKHINKCINHPLVRIIKKDNGRYLISIQPENIKILK